MGILETAEDGVKTKKWAYGEIASYVKAATERHVRDAAEIERRKNDC